MPKGLIVYFSQGGTTARVAESIAAGLRAAKWQVTLCNIKDTQPPAPVGYDLLGIGAPTYYYRAPFKVMDYVNSLPHLNGLPALVFVLHGTYIGDTGNAIRRVLSRKGAREVGYFHCYGADFYLPYLKEGYLFSPDHPTAEELARAERFSRDAAGRIASRQYDRPKEDRSPATIYRLEQFLSNRWMAEQAYSRLFRVDSRRCTLCGLCIKLCPMGNIVEGKRGLLTFGRKCLLCLNCEMLCPEGAITSPASWPLFRPFMMYNVRKASRDPSLEHVRVKHSRGHTQRL
jgi:flavodoxin/NAD-dependent dihydropyrimidine dehydrogenase PreA subunit